MIFSYFLFIPDCFLGNFTFPDTYSFFLHCPFYWHIIVCSNLLWPFVFLWYWLWLFFFQLWFYLHEPSLFFLMSLTQVLSVLLISKYQLFFSLILFTVLSLYFTCVCPVCCQALPHAVARGAWDWVPAWLAAWPGSKGLALTRWLAGLCPELAGYVLESWDWCQPTDGRGWVLIQLAARPLVDGKTSKVQILWNAFLESIW